MTNKDLISKQFIQVNTKKKKKNPNTIKKWSEGLNRHFPQRSLTATQPGHGKMHSTTKFLKKPKSILQGGTTSHQSEWPSLTSLQITNAQEDMEKKGTTLLVGMLTGTSTVEKVRRFLKKLKKSCHRIQQSHSWAYIQTKQ